MGTDDASFLPLTLILLPPFPSSSSILAFILFGRSLAGCLLGGYLIHHPLGPCGVYRPRHLPAFYSEDLLAVVRVGHVVSTANQRPRILEEEIPDLVEPVRSSIQQEQQESLRGLVEAHDEPQREADLGGNVAARLR